MSILPLYAFIPKALNCCDKHAREALDTLEFDTMYTTYRQIQHLKNDISGLEDDLEPPCTDPTHGELHCFDVFCMISRAEKRLDQLVCFKYLETIAKDKNSVDFKVAYLPGAGSQPEHQKRAALQERALKAAQDHQCFWCYNSIFGVTAHSLSRGYGIPEHIKRVPHAMSTGAAMRAAKEAGNQRRFETPSQKPVFGFDDHHNDPFKNMAKAAMYRMGMNLDMNNDFDEVMLAYYKFADSLWEQANHDDKAFEALLVEETQNLSSKEVIEEEALELAKSNLNLISLVTRDKLLFKDPQPVTAPATATTFALSDFIVPSRKQRKQHKI